MSKDGKVLSEAEKISKVKKEKKLKLKKISKINYKDKLWQQKKQVDPLETEEIVLVED